MHASTAKVEVFQYSLLSRLRALGGDVDLRQVAWHRFFVCVELLKGRVQLRTLLLLLDIK